MRLVQADHRLDLIGWLANRPALYKKHVIEAAVDGVPETEPTARFGVAGVGSLMIADVQAALLISNRPM